MRDSKDIKMSTECINCIYIYKYAHIHVVQASNTVQSIELVPIAEKALVHQYLIATLIYLNLLSQMTQKKNF